MHLLSLFPLVPFALFALTIKASPVELELEKRGDGKPCPLGQHHQYYKGGGPCFHNPPNECELVCTSKPHVNASQFGPAQDASFCLHGSLPIAGNPTFVMGDNDNQLKHWRLDNVGDLIFNRNHDESFDGSLTKDGALQMRSYGKASLGSYYFVGLKVGSWVYYYSLGGWQHCDTPAPKAQDQYLLLERVTVFRKV